MIVDLIVAGVLGALDALFSFVPEYTPGSTLDVSWGALAYGEIDRFFPMGTLFQVLAFCLGLRLFVGLYHVVIWLYERFPFKAT